MNQNDQMLKLLNEARKIIRASTSRHLAKDWDVRATQALNHTPDTGDHIGDANKMVRLTEEELNEIAGRVNKTWLANSHRSDLVSLLSSAIMGAIIAKNGGKHDQ